MKYSVFSHEAYCGGSSASLMGVYDTPDARTAALKARALHDTEFDEDGKVIPFMMVDEGKHNAVLLNGVRREFDCFGPANTENEFTMTVFEGSDISEDEADECVYSPNVEDDEKPVKGKQVRACNRAKGKEPAMAASKGKRAALKAWRTMRKAEAKMTVRELSKLAVKRSKAAKKAWATIRAKAAGTWKKNLDEVKGFVKGHKRLPSVA